MRSIAPCKDCKLRKVGCHGTCDLYISWKADNAKQVEKHRKQYQRSREAEINARRVWA